MNAVLKTAPTAYPVSVSELKEHLRVDSGTFDGNLTLTQSLASASHAVADNYTTHTGTGIEVLGYEAIVIASHGTNGSTGTVDTKIQESDDNTTWADWPGGTFTQVTADGAGATEPDNANYKKQYTGGKRYIRTVSKVLLAPCEFGTAVLVNKATAADEDYIEECLKAAIDYAEDSTARQLMTATWYLYLDAFPSSRFIELPLGNLQSVTSLKYKDSDGTETTMTAPTEYLVETRGEGRGRIVLPYGVSWPSFVAYPSNPITIEFVCGYASADVVPTRIKAAIKLKAADLYNNRESETSYQTYDTKAADSLLYPKRLWGF